MSNNKMKSKSSLVRTVKVETNKLVEQTCLPLAANWAEMYVVKLGTRAVTWQAKKWRGLPEEIQNEFKREFPDLLFLSNLIHLLKFNGPYHIDNDAWHVYCHIRLGHQSDWHSSSTCLLCSMPISDDLAINHALSCAAVHRSGDKTRLHNRMVTTTVGFIKPSITAKTPEFHRKNSVSKTRVRHGSNYQN